MYNYGDSNIKTDVHVTDKVTGEYLYTDYNYVIKIGTGLPSYKTIKPLPSYMTYEIAVLEEDEWAVKKDCRGQIVYDKLTKESFEVDFIGDIPDHLTLEVPTEFEDYIVYDNGWTVKLDRLKTFYKNLLRKKCEDEIVKPFPSSALGSEWHYDCRKEDQNNLLSKLLSSDTDSTSKILYAYDLVEWQEIEHTNAQLHQVNTDMEIHIQAKRSHLYIKISAINAASTVEEVKAIAW